MDYIPITKLKKKKRKKKKSNQKELSHRTQLGQLNI